MMRIGNMLKLVEIIEIELKMIRRTNTAKDLKAIENALLVLKANLKRADRAGMNR